eukprot:scaffold85952_cov63-Phaeocystis_antarctica.AAC.2
MSPPSEGRGGMEGAVRQEGGAGGMEGSAGAGRQVVGGGFQSGDSSARLVGASKFWLERGAPTACQIQHPPGRAELSLVRAAFELRRWAHWKQAASNRWR